MDAHVWWLLASLALAPMTALAQDDDADARARAHFDSAVVHFADGEYEDAVAAFAAAYELSHRDALLYNLYLCEERLGHLERAAEHLRAYLATSIVPESDRASLERRLANLEARASDTAAAGEEVEPEPDAPAPDPPQTDPGPLLWSGAIAAGLGVLGLATFGVLGALALNEDQRVAGTCGADAGRHCTEAELATLGDLSLGADVALTVGAVLAATGIALMSVSLVVGGESVTVAAVPTTSGGALFFGAHL